MEKKIKKKLDKVKLELQAELEEYGIGTYDDFFARIKRKAWAFGYNEPEVMLCFGQLMLCKLYDEQYADSCIFKKIKELMESQDKIRSYTHSKTSTSNRIAKLKAELDLLTGFRLGVGTGKYRRPGFKHVGEDLLS